jgi:hypothetical protein
MFEMIPAIYGILSGNFLPQVRKPGIPFVFRYLVIWHVEITIRNRCSRSIM